MIYSSAAAVAHRAAQAPAPSDRRRAAPGHRFASGLFLTLLCVVGTESAAQSCADLRGVFEAVEGVVEIRATEQGPWARVERGSVACVDALIRVSPFGRATLRLPDDTLLKLGSNSSLKLSASSEDGESLVDLIFGIIHVISRDPRFLRFDTPYANAGLEGTEFDLEVGEDRTVVTVIEGEILLRNDAGTLFVPSGQRGAAERSQAPRLASVQDRFDRAAWTPFFVPLLDRALPAPEAEPPAAADTVFYAGRAAARLRVGQPDAAYRDVAQALALDPSSADALALRALLELVRGDREQAAASATRAVELDRNAAAPLLALSYVQQDRLERQAAVNSAQVAVTQEAGNAIAWARLAELRLENDEYFAALGAADRALALDPNLGPAQTVMGFALLMQTDAERAESLFRAAIESDSASPLPRLGLGLTLIRRGELEAGRRQIEIAVILDPRNALMRSYMARVYAAEQRRALTDTQLELARTLAPDDPTAYYYTTLSRQSENRPVEALRAFRTAAALNGNRPRYRSTLGLDEDLAARSAGIGTLHRTLGFEQLAVNTGLASIAADPLDHSGHRLVADVYSTLPRHQIARVNELFLSQMLQPINVTPIPAQLAEPNLFILDNAGPSELAFSEFGPALSSNGLTWQLSGVGATNGTHGVDFALAGLEDRLSYSVGYFEFESDGFRPNNDIDQRVANAFLQYRVSPTTSVQAELRSNRTEYGDLALLFDRAAFDSTRRQIDHVDTARLGVRHDLAGHGTLLASVIYEQVDLHLLFPSTFSMDGQNSSYSLDLRHLYSSARWTLNTGFQLFRQRQSETSSQTIPLPAPPFEVELTNAAEYSSEWASLYAYLDYSLTDRLVASFGMSADRLDSQQRRSDQLNPKVGLTWDLSSRTTARLAAFRTLQGPIVSKRNIQPRLEPTHVGGYNQFFFGTEGDKAWRYGISIDHEFSDALFTGAEVSLRSLDRVTAALFPDGTVVTLDQDIEEAFYRAYVYWAPKPKWSFSAEYRQDDVDGNGLPVPEGYTNIRTRRLPLELNLFHGNGFSSRFEATYVDQSGNFSPMTFGTPDMATPGEDNFWIYDLALIYRLPARRGSLSLNVDNVLDDSFRFQDIDPENPSIVPERMISLRFSLSY